MDIWEIDIAELELEPEEPIGMSMVEFMTMEFWGYGIRCGDLRLESLVALKLSK
jgi:hypothetical protein